MSSAKRYLMLFILIAFFLTANSAFTSFITPVRITVLLVIGYVGLGALAMAAFRCSQASTLRPGGTYMSHVWAYGICIVFMLAYGFLQSNDVMMMGMETLIFGIVFFFMILGRYDEVWDFLQKPMIVLFYLGLVLVIIGLNRPGNASIEGIMGIQSSGDFSTSAEMTLDFRKVKTLAYDVRGLLDFWPILFATAYFRKGSRFWRFLALITPIVCICVQVFAFKFRSVLGQISLQLLAVIIILPAMQRRLRLGPAVVVMLLFLGTLGYLAGTEAYKTTVQRFEEPELWDYRWAEINAVRQYMGGGVDLLVGKGIGGWYPAPSTGITPWRYETHVGLVYPFLKGGLLFCVVLFTLILRAFLPRTRHWYRDPYNAAGTSVLVVFFINQFMIPFPTISLTQATMVFGLSCARMGVPAHVPEDELAPELPQEDYAQDLLPGPTTYGP